MSPPKVGPRHSKSSQTHRSQATHLGNKRETFNIEKGPGCKGKQTPSPHVRLGHSSLPGPAPLCLIPSPDFQAPRIPQDLRQSLRRFFVNQKEGTAGAPCQICSGQHVSEALNLEFCLKWVGCRLECEKPVVMQSEAVKMQGLWGLPAYPPPGSSHRVGTRSWARHLWQHGWTSRWSH